MRMARPMDIAPAGPARLPESGLGRGWEGAAVMGLTLLVLSFGLVTLYSASSVFALSQGMPDTFYVVRQGAGAVVGLALLGFCAWMPYRYWALLAWPLVAASVVMLTLCVLPWTYGIAPEINGARRWLRVGVTIQPSEIAKVAIIVWSSAMAVRKAPQFKSLRRGLGPFLAVWGLVIGLVTMGPDLSTALVVATLGFVIVFSAGARIAHFVFLGALVTPALFMLLRAPYRWERIKVFGGQLTDPAGAGYQVKQSLIGIGSGGLYGVGFGEGQQKHGFLPEAHNDFIFAMIGEEWGFFGILLVVGVYSALVLIGFRIASRAPDLFGELLAIGCTSLVAVQATLHMAVGLALAPATGLALPLISYGRSNLIVTLITLGILISVARAAPGGKAARV
ncbi:MAG: putative peptidoglycan glycosyltransferase FtsW [Gemmatimonadota bacterium]|nr:putative peptidoglycan glycosyltransferase FtsW [Gemmatimonadota bacterium]MDE3015131.1 putative peptidoglycan glycosyltransferase FtsW [Gemmatimonadota bacterium]